MGFNINIQSKDQDWRPQDWSNNGVEADELSLKVDLKEKHGSTKGYLINAYLWEEQSHEDEGDGSGEYLKHVDLHSRANWY